MSEIRVCKICKNTSGNKSHIIHEMSYGLREPFEYIECASCGCLQIKEIPQNLYKYYPEDYYSYRIKSIPGANPVRTFLRRQRFKYCLFGKNKLWPLRSKKYDSFKWFKKTKVKFDSSILDVGCGYGKLLNRMQRDGFQNLTGVDPFIKENLIHPNGVKIFKKDIFELEGQFDLIISNDSFEHMPDPLKALKRFYDLLKHNKFVLISTPIASSFAWRHYGVNWVALEAPRHLFIHTIKSIQLLSRQAGFEILDIDFVSTERQFVYSELYRKDISFVESSKYLQDSRLSIFSKKQIENFKAQANELNRNRDGDQARFYLYKE